MIVQHLETPEQMTNWTPIQGTKFVIVYTYKGLGSSPDLTLECEDDVVVQQRLLLLIGLIANTGKISNIRVEEYDDEWNVLNGD